MKPVQRIHLSAFLLALAAVWGVLLMLQGIAVTPEFLKPLSPVVGFGLLLLTAFDLWLWRVPVLHGWFVKRPRLWGTWKVTFQSNWIDRATKKGVGPIEGFMVVRQTYSRISMRMMTAESTSQLLVDDLVLSADGTFRIFAVYQNEPKIAVRDRSPVHYGGLALTVQGSPATSMEGFYWTDRCTRGDIVLKDRRKEAYDSYELASAAFAVAPQKRRRRA